MGATGIIFRREFGAYVRSPMGYIVAAVVLLLDGILFYALALGPRTGELLSGEVLMRFFYYASGLTAIAAVALSIRLIAEERAAGTQLLLNTSPVRDWEIVLGKFLSALAFLSAITVATLYMPLMILVNGKIAFGHIVVGYLGLTFLGAAVLSIGLFATALTRHQLVAAASASVITGTLFLLWPLSQMVGPPLSRVFAALAIHGRHWAGFQQGLFHLRDIVYYVALTYFFLYAATKVMEAKRWE
ncbi:MAG: ABC transporter permease subunit [Gemmatimonadota bacterium]|nr:ABC transporter permease subunit [Gemmatimonadota bacterium]